MIRRYRASDMEDVLGVWLRASRAAHPFLSEDFLLAERDKIRDLHMPNAESWVWEEEGQVQGFIALIGNEVGGLFVCPERHRRGIGRALVDTACRRYRTLEVEVFKANAIGRSFYEKYGFVLFKELIDAGTGQPVLRLRYSQ